MIIAISIMLQQPNEKASAITKIEKNVNKLYLLKLKVENLTRMVLMVIDFNFSIQKSI